MEITVGEILVFVSVVVGTIAILHSAKNLSEKLEAVSQALLEAEKLAEKTESKTDDVAVDTAQALVTLLSTLLAIKPTTPALEETKEMPPLENEVKG